MNIFAPVLHFSNPQSNFPLASPEFQYSQELSYLAKNRVEKVFNNGKPAHAAIVMENIFRETGKCPKGGEVRIYAKNLNGEISKYSNYRHSLLEFLLSQNTAIKVIIDEEPTNVVTETNAFNLLTTFSKTQKLNGKIHLRKVSNPGKVAHLVQDQLQFSDVHFAVSTENMYRFEIDSALHFAECSFNGPSMSQQLTQVFDTMFSNNQGNYTTPIV